MSLDTMRLSLSQKVEQEEREAAWLRALEAGDTTVNDLVAITGLSRNRIYERLKRARENREIEPETGPGNELDEAIYLELIMPAEGAKGRAWYSLTSDQTSHDGTGCAVLTTNHNGTRLRRNRLGTGDHVKDPGGPTKHQPDPDGLKGGVG